MSTTRGAVLSYLFCVLILRFALPYRECKLNIFIDSSLESAMGKESCFFFSYFVGAIRVA